jgi:hypothetical protein
MTELEKLRLALLYYANPQNYRLYMLVDKGRLAREVLGPVSGPEADKAAEYADDHVPGWPKEFWGLWPQMHPDQQPKFSLELPEGATTHVPASQAP